MKPIIGITQDMEYKKDGAGFRAYLHKSYADSVYRMGGMPLMLPIIADAASEYADRIDGLLLSGGDDIHPRHYGEELAEGVSLSPDERTTFEFALLKETLARKKPVLGICLGVQTINVYFGGSLHQDIPGHKGKDDDLYHEVTLAEGGRLRQILGVGRLRVNSYHHQALKGIGKGLIASASSEDGIVEAVELPGEQFVVGVQWHPERMVEDPFAEKLFKAFIEASK